MSGTVRDASAVRIVSMRLTKTGHLAGHMLPTRVYLVVLALAMGLSVPAMVPAQTAPVPPPQAKPTPAAPTAGAPESKPAAPRTRIELPPAERQALDSGASVNRPTTPTRNELLPNADDATTTIIDEPANVIEQIRTSNRISEIRVTPAMTGHTYIMTNREGRQPTTATDTTSGLSVPKFFTFEFGRQADRPAAALPPPPSSTSR